MPITPPDVSAVLIDALSTIWESIPGLIPTTKLEQFSYTLVKSKLVEFTNTFHGII